MRDERSCRVFGGVVIFRFRGFYLSLGSHLCHREALRMAPSGLLLPQRSGRRFETATGVCRAHGVPFGGVVFRASVRCEVGFVDA